MQQPLEAAIGSLTRARALDVPARKLIAYANRFLKPGVAKDVLSGTYLGHPAHPLLTDVPIGLWTSAVFLDLFGGRKARRAARRLVGAGVLAAVPTAITGLSDLADVEDHDQRRVGIVHAAANVSALVMFALSHARRANGGGRLLGLLGVGAVTAGGYLGGHLSYRSGLGVNTTAFETKIEEWTRALPEAELEERTPRRVVVRRNEIMLFRRDERIYALANRCTHRGGPLYKGRIERDCVICPWHLSTFALDDGAIVRGPATAPQRAYDVRVTDGTIEVRSRE
jgi:nitrite reductase/ring-hydroxylating ferredoxin subunit